MPTKKRAEHVQKMMGKDYHIYWDDHYLCFRVMKENSLSFYLWKNHYTLID